MVGELFNTKNSEAISTRIEVEQHVCVFLRFWFSCYSLLVKEGIDIGVLKNPICDNMIMKRKIIVRNLFICELGHAKNKLQKTNMHWMLERLKSKLYYFLYFYYNRQLNWMKRVFIFSIHRHLYLKDHGRRFHKFVSKFD